MASVSRAGCWFPRWHVFDHWYCGEPCAANDSTARLDAYSCEDLSWSCWDKTFRQRWCLTACRRSYCVQLKIPDLIPHCRFESREISYIWSILNSWWLLNKAPFELECAWNFKNLLCVHFFLAMDVQPLKEYFHTYGKSPGISFEEYVMGGVAQAPRIYDRGTVSSQHSQINLKPLVATTNVHTHASS